MEFDLVFEGGGAKGMVFVGACEEFFDRGHEFGRLLGTSAGAITATLLAAGYQPQEMRDVLTETKNGASVFSTFMGPPKEFTDEELGNGTLRQVFDGIDFTFIWDRWESIAESKLVKALATNEKARHFVALIERGACFEADAFVTWLGEKLDQGTVSQTRRQFSGLTMSQFFDATRVELSLVASDTTASRLLVINRHTAPDCPIISAVRMSMSLPLVWQEVTWGESWGKYRDMDISGHTIVDGGILSNFPIELFVSDQPSTIDLMGPKRGMPILGMLIDENLPVDQAFGSITGVEIEINYSDLAAVKRLERLVNTMTSAHDNKVIDECEDLVVRLPAKGYGTTEFNMSDTRRDSLVAAGRRAMAEYLDRLEAESQDPSHSFGATGLSAADRVASKILALE